MKSRVILPALLAVGLLYLAAASSAQAFDFGCGCGAAPSCGCGVEPTCGCNPCGAPRCCRMGLFARMRAHKCCNQSCCAPTCGCEPSCGCGAAPTCGCGAAPTCGCEPSCGCNVGCGHKCCRPGLLARLRARKCCKQACCANTCCAPAPSCGCGY